MKAAKLGTMKFDRWEIVLSEREMGEAIHAFAVARGIKLPPWNPEHSAGAIEFDYEEQRGEFALAVRLPTESETP